jgi:hypothetical protein
VCAKKLVSEQWKQRLILWKKIDRGKEMMDSEEEQNDETYVEVDLEEELIFALSEIKKLKNNNLK